MMEPSACGPAGAERVRDMTHSHEKGSALLASHEAGHGQNAFPGTPAQGSGMLGSWGSGSITVRVCFG